MASPARPPMLRTPLAAAAYATGRGGFRVRARYEVEKLKGGTYQIVVTEIPYQVPKSRLVEKIAELLSAKKLPVLADIRDESAVAGSASITAQPFVATAERVRLPRRSFLGGSPRLGRLGCLRRVRRRRGALFPRFG